MKHSWTTQYFCTRDFMPGRALKDKKEAIAEFADMTTQWFHKYGHTNTTVTPVYIIDLINNPRGELVQFETTAEFPNDPSNQEVH